MRQSGVVLLCLCVAACGERSASNHPTALSAAEAAFQQRLQEQFLDAKPGTVIRIPPGKHRLDRVLTLRANGVTTACIARRRSTAMSSGTWHRSGT